MNRMKDIELEIEEVRDEMYQAHEKFKTYEEIVRVSQKLDSLLNELEELHK